MNTQPTERAQRQRGPTSGTRRRRKDPQQSEQGHKAMEQQESFDSHIIRISRPNAVGRLLRRLRSNAVDLDGYFYSSTVKEKCPLKRAGDPGGNTQK